MGKELVWIDEELVGKVELIQDIARLNGTKLEELAKRISDNTTTIITDNIDVLLLETKLHAKKVRDEYEKVVNEELEATNTLWDTCDEKIYESRTKIAKVKDMFVDVNREINKCTASLSAIPVYNLEKLMEVLDKFNSYSEKDKELLRLLFNNENK